MPRPGPGPYEYVRRAWHSDRHQPIRGSLIQDLFRIVNEIHGPSTKKNKEWQEKLPTVVLKVEEIMYSKANSEAEYIDITTLWDRANDAINTIIRRDESTETGELLQPCIEENSSFKHQHGDYKNLKSIEISNYMAALNLGCTARRVSRSQRNTNPICYLNPNSEEHKTDSHFTSHYPNIIKSKILDSNPSSKSNSPKKQPFSPKKLLPSTRQDYYSKEISKPLNLFSVHSKTIDESQFSCILEASNKIRKMNFEDVPENPCGMACDLALRLAPVQEVEDVGSSSSQQGSKFSLDSCSSERCHGDKWSTKAAMIKRKRRNNQVARKESSTKVMK